MKFLALCPCEKVVFDKRDAPSLIVIMQAVEVAFQAIGGQSVQPDTKIPEDAVLPKEWFVYSRWESSAEDVGKNFEQVWQIYWPSGEKFVEHRFTLKPIKQNDDIQQSYIQMVGFPSGQAGKLRISTWLDCGGQRITDIIECSLLVKHAPLPAVDNVVTSVPS